MITHLVAKICIVFAGPRAGFKLAAAARVAAVNLASVKKEPGIGVAGVFVLLPSVVSTCVADTSVREPRVVADERWRLVAGDTQES
jgi:hypothetical protein